MKTVMGVGTIRLNSASAQFSANFNKVVADAETSKRFGHAIDRKALGNRRKIKLQSAGLKDHPSGTER